MKVSTQHKKKTYDYLQKKVLHQNLWVNRMELSNWDTGLRPDGFIALAPIPKKKVGGGVIDADRPIFGLGPCHRRSGRFPPPAYPPRQVASHCSIC